ncbi:hypothetical protein PENSPDRAFT_692083 [Peniophora sp. CONT]|nr:hypothetical protein PENSPDRAFT_692083 [Peniophora sp. CONT]
MRSFLGGITLGCVLWKPRSTARKGSQTRANSQSARPFPVVDGASMPSLPEDMAILNTSIDCMGQAVQCAAKADPDALCNLGHFLAHRYMLLENIEDLHEAIIVLGSAVELMSDGHDDKPARLDDICHRALNLGPDSHPDKALFSNHLGLALQQRFERLNDIHDLTGAITAHRVLVELTPDDHPNKPMRVGDLCTSLLSRHLHLNEDGELQTAISLLRQASLLLPESHPDRLKVLDSLDSAVQRRYERLGLTYDLENAATVDRRRAVELFPNGGSDDLVQLSNRGLLLQEQYKRSGDPEDLEAAISVARLAVGITPQDHPDQPLLLNSLGMYLRDRYERTGGLEDLETAIRLHRLAAELIPSNHIDIPMHIHNLAVCLHERYERLGEPHDIETAIHMDQRAVELTTEDDPDMTIWLNGLGTVFLARYKRLKKINDLNSAISAYRRAIEITPASNSYLPSRLNNLGNALQKRHISSLPSRHPSKPMRLNSLGVSLQMRYELLHELDDLEAAISVHHRAVELMRDGHADNPMWLNSLGIALSRRFEYTQTQSDFDATVEFFMAATSQASASPSTRLESASGCLSLLNRYPRLRSPDTLLLAHSRIIGLLPELVWLGHNIERRYEESAKLRGFVNNAVSGAISVGAVHKAVECLDEGRALVWAQILTMRTPLDELAQHHPDLAHELRNVQTQLQNSGYRSALPEPRKDDNTMPGIVTADEGSHRQLVIKYERLLGQARGYPGFENFMRPQKLATLSNVTDGPIVFINVDMHRCDALIVSVEGATNIVPLPDLSEKRAYQLLALWHNLLVSSGVLQKGAVPENMALRGGSTRMGIMLERLWTWVVGPILKELNITEPMSDSRPPHITWCPTGPLTQVPLHAAGLYSQEGGPRAFNLVVSSYTPSLSALSRSREGLAKHHADPNVLVVTQPHTPGLSALPGTKSEGARLRDLLAESNITSTAFDDKEATVDSVRAVIDQHTWVHLACHGSQHLADPTKSAFALYDGPLSLTDLMATAADNAELAFLSACQTAVGDE